MSLDVFSVAAILIGVAIIVLRRAYVRLFLLEQQVMFGRRIVSANTRRIAAFAVILGVALVVIGVAGIFGV